MDLSRAHIIALRLAKAGYAGGDPQKILGMPAELVLEMHHWEGFQADYERQFLRINRKDDGGKA